MRCLLVSPQSRGLSFWIYPATWSLRGARYSAAPLGLLTVAALLPSDWQLRLVDRNVQELRDEDLHWADLVMVGGMITQQHDHLELVERCRRIARRVVCGGPGPTSSPHLYAGADHLVLDEAEVTLPEFLADLAHGRARPCYRATRRAAMDASPVPRWDLVDVSRYLYPGLQWSRGCPFNCEFCDIIELYGRVPRLKGIAQVLHELDALYRVGHRGHVEFVDDNLIGNQRELLPLLAEVSSWQRARGYPFEFSCEASINLADRPTLLEAMREAGFIGVFVGVETPDPAVLSTAQKHQNTRRDLVASVHRLYAYGMHVYAGYIVGMDGESDRAADEMIACIQESAVPVNMTGLLFALPTTQLAARLEREGRLSQGYEVWPSQQAGDQCLGGLNFRTQRPRAEILRDYARVLRTVYAPAAYFARLRQLARRLDMRGHRLAFDARRQGRELTTFLRMVWRMGVQSTWRRHWWAFLAEVALRNPRAFRYLIWSSAFYCHFEEFLERLLPLLEARIETESQGVAQ